MSDTEPSPQSRNSLRRLRDDALQLGPRKKASVHVPLITTLLRLMIYLFSCLPDPLIHHGRHFGRTIHALCSVHSVILNGVLRLGELADEPLESFTSEYVPFLHIFSSDTYLCCVPDTDATSVSLTCF